MHAPVNMTALKRSGYAWLAVLAIALSACHDATTVQRDASRLMFVSDPSYDTMFVASARDGAIEERIALPLSGSNVRVSPAGDRLAIVATGGLLWVMNIDGTSARQVASSALNATWAPDGLRLAYATQGPPPQLHIVNADGSGDVVVAGAKPEGWLGLSWSPDGRRIAFEGMRGGARTIYLVNIDGTNLRDLDLELGGPNARSTGEPTWSPDGRKLAFSRFVFYGDRPAETTLWVANVVTGRSWQITSGPGADDVRPAWSPHGDDIAFLRFEGTRSDVFVVGHDGTGLRQITNTPALREETPQWLPPRRTPW